MPTGSPLSRVSPIGNVALLESSASSVVVNTLVILSASTSVDKGVLERDIRPMSGVAVDEKINRSCKDGGKSFKRAAV